MRVLKALLARTCIPLCFIQILKFESGQIIPSDIVFLQVLLMFTTVWICDIVYMEPPVHAGILSRLFGGTSFITCMFFAFGITHDFLKTGSDSRKYLLIDYGFPFLCFNQLLQWTCYEMWCLVFFIYSYLKAVGVGPVKRVCYLSYLSIHAIIVIFIIETISLVIVTQVYFTLRDNFYYTFDANTSHAYPIGYLNPLILDRGMYDKATMKTEFYSCPPGRYSTCSLTRRAEDTVNVEYPFNSEMIYRYIGEDVEMKCEFIVITSSISVAKMQHPVWYFNDSVIANGSRHSQFNWYNPIGESVNVFSLLKIKFLKNADFGEYICSCTLTTSQYILKQSGYLEEEHRIEKPTLNVFTLEQIKVQPRLVYRIVGNLITSENFFWYNSAEDINDMSIAYTINDRPVDEVCPGFQTQTCSLGASILRNFIRFGAQKFDWNGAVGFPFIEIGEVPMFDLKRGIVYFCLCSSGYGIHQISFFRKVYTGMSKKYRNEEIIHPFVFIVLPLSTVSLFRFQDDTHLYTNIEKLVQEEANFEVIEDVVKDVIEFIKSNEEKVFTIANVIQTVILINCVIFFYTSTLIVSNVYMSLFIQYVPRRVFMHRPMLPDAPPPLAIKQYQYDIFISYAEEDDGFVTGVLAPFLEDECHLRICIPRRDFPLSRSIFSLYVDQIQRSRKVIVILSQSYMAEAHCVHLQLEHIIMPSLYENIRDQQNILILRYDTTPVPYLLKWNFHIEVLKWYEQLPLGVKLRNLKKWIYFGQI